MGFSAPKVTIDLDYHEEEEEDGEEDSATEGLALDPADFTVKALRVYLRGDFHTSGKELQDAIAREMRAKNRDGAVDVLKQPTTGPSAPTSERSRITVPPAPDPAQVAAIEKLAQRAVDVSRRLIVHEVPVNVQISSPWEWARGDPVRCARRLPTWRLRRCWRITYTPRGRSRKPMNPDLALLLAAVAAGLAICALVGLALTTWLVVRYVDHRQRIERRQAGLPELPREPKKKKREPIPDEIRAMIEPFESPQVRMALEEECYELHEGAVCHGQRFSGH